MAETNKILAILDNYLHDNPDEIAKEIAAEFRLRRIEKNLTREQVAEKSGVAVSNFVYTKKRLTEVTCYCSTSISRLMTITVFY